MNNQILFMSSALFCRLLFLLQHRFLLKSFTAIVVWCEARHGDENFRHFYPCIGASEEGFVWGTLSSLEAFCTAGPAEERAYPCLSCLTIDPISLKMYSNFTPARLISICIYISGFGMHEKPVTRNTQIYFVVCPWGVLDLPLQLWKQKKHISHTTLDTFSGTTQLCHWGQL